MMDAEARRRGAMSERRVGHSQLVVHNQRIVKEADMTDHIMQFFAYMHLPPELILNEKDLLLVLEERKQIAAVIRARALVTP